MTTSERELRAAWESSIRSEQRGRLEGHRQGWIKGFVVGWSTAIGLVFLLTAALDWYWAWAAY